jgi:hypothetical protein
MKQLIGYLITISILLSQDILTTKAGNVYEGNLISHTTGDVDFISKGVHHSLPTSMVQRLVLEDGTVLIREGKQFGKFRLTFEEYQKLRVKEKAIYDARSKHLNHWYLYGSISTIIFSGNYFLGHQNSYWSRAYPFISKGSLALAVPLTIRNVILNRKEKFNFPKSIMTDSEKEIYDQTYSIELKKRKFKYIVGSTIATGVISVIIVQIMFLVSPSLNESPGPGGVW